jgi:hypothetical protein
MWRCVVEGKVQVSIGRSRDHRRSLFDLFAVMLSLIPPQLQHARIILQHTAVAIAVTAFFARS